MKPPKLNPTTAAIAFVLATSAIVSPAFAGGGACPACATEPTQIMNNVQLVTQYIKQVQQHATQVQNMVTNIAKLNDAIVQATNFSMRELKPFYDLAGSLRTIGETVQNTKAIAYSMRNLDDRFRAQFKGYLANPNVGAQYQQWSDTVNETLISTLKGIELTQEEIKNETTFAERLRDMAATSKGRNQLEQTIIAFADSSIGQMQKMRTLMLMDMQSKQAYQAYQVNKEMLLEANTEKALTQNITNQSKSKTTAELK